VASDGVSEEARTRCFATPAFAGCALIAVSGVDGTIVRAGVWSVKRISRSFSLVAGSHLSMQCRTWMDYARSCDGVVAQ
jgi:hypothetical protein